EHLEFAHNFDIPLLCLILWWLLHADDVNSWYSAKPPSPTDAVDSFMSVDEIIQDLNSCRIRSFVAQEDNEPSLKARLLKTCKNIALEAFAQKTRIQGISIYDS